MKKKFKLILALLSTSLMCVGAACASETKVEENEKNGYTVSVTYDANGGSFLNRPGITIMDMFNPDKYQADGEGVKHIKLMEPTSPDRDKSGSGRITLTLQNHFFAGWYQNREVKTVDGTPVDAEGKALALLEDGTYVYADTKDSQQPVVATPAYNYSGYWDFKEDTIDYTGEKVALTLYAGWVPYYEFNYYYQENNEWKKLDTVTSFDYKTNVESNLDLDTIWLPDWKDGAMNHEYAYANSSVYTFPKISGVTFDKAYLDEDCQNQVSATFRHQGVLNPDAGENGTLVVENRVQNVYITTTAGEQYRITTAEQLSKNANPNGLYEIYSDELDFTNVEWPMMFASNEFNGSMFGKEGKAVTLKNISVSYNTKAAYGGVFGKLTDTAKLTNLTFENITFDLVSVGQRNHDASFGMFAGMIDDGATLTNVTVSGMFKIGLITPGNNPEFNLLANGKTDGITVTSLALRFYGSKLGNQYEYTCEPEKAGSIQVDKESGDITIAFVTSYRTNQEYYDIEI